MVGGLVVQSKTPITVDDGPLQTLNVRSYLKNIVQFCFGCVDRNIKDKKRQKNQCERC